MDWADTPEQAAFREQVRELVEGNLPEYYRTRLERNATVTAKTDVTVIHLDGRAFSAMLEKAPQIAVKMLPVVAGRVAGREDTPC